MITTALLVSLLAGFPIPSESGTPCSWDKGCVRLARTFEAVSTYYRQRFKAGREVAFTTEGAAPNRVLVVRNLNKADVWSKATVREDGGATLVVVTQHIVATGEEVSAKPPRPLMEFVFARSAEVKKALDSIEPSNQLASP